MDWDHNASPFNAVPPVVLALVGAMFAVELWFVLSQSGIVGATRGGDDARIFALQRFAFSGEIMSLMVERGEYPPAQVMRVVTYPFVHGGFTHMIFAGVFTLALGKMVGEVLGQVAVAVLFLAGTVAGAMAFWLLAGGGALYGAFPGAYALIGGYTYIMWVHLGRMGESQYRAFSLIGVLLVFQLVFGVLFGAGNDWIGDIGGFFAGLFLSVPLAPGGWRRLMERMRRR
ncbi:MAG: rhomboid family intramembrane serine protease [Vannielia sp.]|uniref:rhomboid family intramembrane serine protease n=1 Tax=Rhodobacterales TaxID=204455 RepID=UPI002095271C|nr:rhomboid family intramembrane serine protease [Oceanicola sp. 502str15]MCO6383774.1 rhomboid family intramembrane serine protease [Oceanicola sp. 502str15]